MEGDGEGLVAIVQDLNAAGVTLTVVNRPIHARQCTRSSKNLKINPLNTTMPLKHQRSSVETCTDCVNMTNTGVQICDGRYASSYKLAHCRMVPTSPPEPVSEFPPQRPEPCRNQGNFEVGGHGSGHLRPNIARSRYFGGNQNWGERGSAHRSKANRGTDAFVHSLRKYPSIPVTSVSTDLIEKLIKYTQSKNASKTSRPTKSLRSLHKDRSSDTNDINRVSKHQQTYTRRQDNDGPNISSGQLGYRGRTRNFKLYSPLSDNRNIKYRDTSFSSSYDYLKAGSSRYFDSPDRVESPHRIDRGARAQADKPSRPEWPIRSSRDIRLNDVSRYIRSTIREIYSERPVVFQVCPKLKNRYNQHKKNCPSKCTDSMICDEEEQASTPVLSRLLASLTGCSMPSTAAKGTSNSEIVCACNKATQCSCVSDASTSMPLLDMDENESSKSVYCNCCPYTKDKPSQGSSQCECIEENVRESVECRCRQEDTTYYHHRIDEVIADWLQDVPIHSIESPANKKKREKMVSELGNSLKKLPDDINFSDNVRKEIDSFMEGFPIWYPRKRKQDEEEFKKQLADKLYDDIIDIPRKPDRFRDVVKKWIKDIDFTSDDINPDSVTNDFVRELKALAFDRPKSDSTYKNMLNEKIVEMLKDLPINTQGDTDEELNKLADKLATEIVHIPKNVDLTDELPPDLREEFEENVTDWLNELLTLVDNMDDVVMNPKLIEDLAKKLNKLQTLGIYDDEVVEKMREEVNRFTADANIALGTLEELTEELVDQIKSTVQMSEIENLDQDELGEIIIDWLRSVPDIAELHVQKFKKIAEDLTNKIKEAKQEGKDDLQDIVLDCIVDADLTIDPDALSQHIQELMEILKTWPSNEPQKEKAKVEIITDIDKIVEASTLPEDKKNELKNKLMGIVVHNLSKSQLDLGKREDDMEEALLEDLDAVFDEVSISNEGKYDLKNKISCAITKTLSRRRLSSNGENDLKQEIANDVRTAIKKLPIDKEKKKALMDRVKADLTKKIDKPLPDDVEDTIKKEISDIIDKTPISEDRNILDYIKNKISCAATKVIDIFTPKKNRVGDIKSKVEENVNKVIEKSSMDEKEKDEIKQKIQDILLNNEERRLSEEVKDYMQEQIVDEIDTSSLPNDKKVDLMKTLVATLSQDFDSALSGLKRDISKIKNKMAKDVYNAIEQSPIDRNNKVNLKRKLKSVIESNLDSSLSDEQKYTIIEDIPSIVNESIPKHKRGDYKDKLKNTLAKKLDAMSKQETYTEELKDIVEKDIANIIDDATLTEKDKEELKRLLENTLARSAGKQVSDVKDKIKEEFNDYIQNSSITQTEKENLKNKMNNILSKKMAGLSSENVKMDDYKNAITKDISTLLDKLPVDLSKKNELKDEVENMLGETLYRPLTDKMKATVEDDIASIINDSSIPIEEFENVKPKLDAILTKGLEESSKKGKNVGNVKNYITKGIGSIIDGLKVSKAKKNILKRRVKDALAETLDEPMSDKIQDKIKVKFAKILEKSSIPENNKTKLKNNVANIVGHKFNLSQPREDEDVEKTDMKKIITQDIEEVLDSLAIDDNIKKQMNRGVKFILDESLYRPLTDDVKRNMTNDILNVIEDINIPRNNKNDLKANIDNTLTEEVESLINLGKDVGEIRKALNTILSDVIENSPISEYKKKVLKKKVKDTLKENLMKPMSDEVKEKMRDKLSGVMDDSIISEGEKSDLRYQVSNVIDKNFDKWQTHAEESKATDKTTQKVLDGIEKAIAELSIPEDKKKELQTKLKNMTVENLKKPLSANVQDAMKDGMINILDELPISKDQKNKLRNDLTDMLDENIVSLQNYVKEQDTKHLQKLETHALDNILHGIEKFVEHSPISSPEKKKELNQKLADLTTQSFKKDRPDDVQVAFKDGIGDIVDKVPLSEDKKNELKDELINLVDKHIETWRDDIEEFENVQISRNYVADSQESETISKRLVTDSESKAQENIMQGIEKTIDESPIPSDKKNELKNKLKTMAAQNLVGPVSGDVQSAIKLGIKDILDELPITKGTKNQLKNKLTNVVEQNIEPIQDKIKNEQFKQQEAKLANRALDNILQGLETSIEISPITSPQKKKEIKAKLSDIATQSFKEVKPDEVAHALKDGIKNIINKVPLAKDKQKELKTELTNVVEENIDSWRDDIEELKAKQISKDEGTTTEGLVTHQKTEELKAEENIMKGIEDTIEESPIPPEKKEELKNKLKTMAAKNLTRPTSDNLQTALNLGINDILNDLPLPKANKDKIKNQLTTVVEKNIKPFEDQAKQKEYMKNQEAKLANRALDNILQGLQTSIDESPISSPQSKKQLKAKLSDIAIKSFKEAKPDDVQHALEDGIDKIVDKVPLAIDKKNELKSELTHVVEENIDVWRDHIEELKAKQLSNQKDTTTKSLITDTDTKESKAEANIMQGIEKTIEESSVPPEKKEELKNKLKTMATQNLTSPLSGDVQSAINLGIMEILDELPVSVAKKEELKNELTNVVEQNIEPIQDKIKKEEFKQQEAKLANRALDNILQGLDTSIEVSPISSPQKKKEIKAKLSDIVTQSFKEAKPDDVAHALKDGIENIIDKLPLAIDKQNELKTELTNVVEENIDSWRDDIEELKAKQISKDEGTTTEGLVTHQKTEELKAEENIMKGIEDTIEESPIPPKKKEELKNKLKSMATKNLTRPTSDNLQTALNLGINDILNDLPLPKANKDNIKNQLTTVVEKNIKPFEDQAKQKEYIKDQEAKLANRALDNILQGLQTSIDESPISSPQSKKQLKAKLSDIAIKSFKEVKPDDVQHALENSIDKIVDMVPLARDKKNELKSELTHVVEENIDVWRDDIEELKAKQVSNQKDTTTKSLITNTDTKESKAEVNIMQGIEKTIEESSVPPEKKEELKNKLKSMATQNLASPLSYDVQSAINLGIMEILDELPVSAAKKEELKNELTNVVEQNIEPIQDKIKKEDFKQQEAKLANRALDNILQGLVTSIDVSPISSPVRKKELKAKLSDIMTHSFKEVKPDDVQHALGNGIENIIDKVSLTKDEKNELKNVLTNVVEENIDVWRDDIEELKAQQILKDKETATRSPITDTYINENIMHGIEKTIEQSEMPREKKEEIKNKMKKMATQSLKDPLSVNVHSALNDDINNILAELPLSNTKKNEMKNDFLNIFDDNIEVLRDELKKEEVKQQKTKLATQAQEGILLDLQNLIERSPITAPEEKKEFNRQITKMVTESFKDTDTYAVQDAINYGIDNIVDKAPISNDEKEELKFALNDVVDEYIDTWRDDIEMFQNIETTIENIMQGIDWTIEESPVPQEKKMEFKQKLKTMANKILIDPLHKDVEVDINEGVDAIFDELTLSEDKKNELKNKLTNIVKENIESLREKVKKEEDAKQHENILANRAERRIQKGIRKTIEASPISSPDIKKEFQIKFRDMVIESFVLPSIDDIHDALKEGIDMIMDEAPLSEDGKIQFKDQITNLVNKNMDTWRQHFEELVNLDITTKSTDEPKEKRKSIAAKKIEESKEIEKIMQKIEKSITKSPITQDKKENLHKEIKEEIDENLSHLRDDIKKEQLQMKRAAVAASKRRKKHEKPLFPQTQDPIYTVKKNVMHGIDKTVEDLPISSEDKEELKNKLKSLSTKKLTYPLPDNFQDTMNDGILNILDELPMSKAEKTELNNTLTNMVQQNIEPLQEKIKEQCAEYDNIKESIMQGIERTIEESQIPEEKKEELKSKLKSMTADNLKKPFTANLHNTIKDGVSKILDELPVSETQKNKLKDGLTQMVDENVKSMQDDTIQGTNDFHKLETLAQANILQALQKSIEESPISIEKKIELQKKIQDMASKSFESDNIHDALIDGINEILEELPLSPKEINEMQTEMVLVVDENMSGLNDNIKANKAKILGIPDTKEAIKTKKKSLLSVINVDESLKEDVTDILEKNNIDPKFKKEIEAVIIPELEDLVVRGGDIESVKDKVKLKIMQGTNLSEEQADDLTRDLIERAREMTLIAKSCDSDLYNKHRLSLCAIKKHRLTELSEKDFLDSPEQIQLGDVNKYTIDGVRYEADNEDALEDILSQKIAEIELDKAEPLKNRLKNTMSKAIGDVIDQSVIPNTEKIYLKAKFQNKLEQYLDKTPLTQKRDIDVVKDEMLKDTKTIIDKSLVPTEKRKSLKFKLEQVLVEDFDKIADEFLENQFAPAATSTPKKGKPSQSGSIQMVQKSSPKDNLDINESLKEEFEDIFDRQNIDPRIKKEIQEDIISKLEDLVIFGGDIECAKDKVKLKIMQDTNLSEEQADDLTCDLIEKAQEMTLVVKSCDSDLYNKYRLSLCPLKKHRLTELSDKEFLDSPEQIKVGDVNKYIIDGVRYEADDEDALEDVLSQKIAEIEIEKAELLKNRLKDTMSKAIGDVIDQSVIPNTEKSNLKAKFQSKLEQNFDKTPLTQKRDVDVVKDEMLKDTKTIIDKSSVPTGKRKSLKFKLEQVLIKDFDEFLQENEFVPVATFSPDKPKGVQLAQEPTGKEYAEDVVDSIKNWMVNLPIDLDPAVKTAIMNDLANDIISRQKYLQAHPEAKISDKEELDNLKYQVFRRLSKTVEPEDMADIFKGTEELLQKITKLEVPQDIPKLPPIGLTAEGRSRKRRSESTSQGARRSTAPAISPEKLKDPLKEEVADVLDVNKVFTKNREALETDITNALEEFAIKGGDEGGARTSVRKSILQMTKLSPFEAEDVSTKLVTRAREMSLLAKTQDSEPYHRTRLSTSEGTKYRFSEDKELIVSPDKIQLAKNKKAQTDLEQISGFVQDANDDSGSAKMEVTNVPKIDRTAIKKRLKETLFKNIGDVINNTSLSVARKKELNDKLKNVMEKNLEQSALKDKKDIEGVKMIMMTDMHETIDDSSIPKAKKVFLKSKVTEVLEKDLNESILTDSNVKNGRLSKDVAKQPLNGNNRKRYSDKSTEVDADVREKDINESNPASSNVKKERLSIDSRDTDNPKGTNFKKERLSRQLDDVGKSSTNDNNKKQLKDEFTEVDDVIKGTPYSFDAPKSQKHFMPQGYSTPKKLKENEEPSKHTEIDNMKRVKNIVENWMDEIPHNLEESVRDKIIRQYTGDVVDRQKYLQVNPKAKRSDEEEREDFKHKLYDRMNKHVNDDELAPIMDGKPTKEMLDEITRVSKIAPPGDSDTDDGPRKPKRKSLTAPETLTSLTDPLHEEVVEILDAHNIFGDEREVLEDELTDALERVTATGGDNEDVTRVVIENLKDYTDIDDEKAQETAQELIGAAREMALIVKIQEKDKTYIEQEGLPRRLLTDDPDLVMKTLEEKEPDSSNAPEKIIINKKVFKNAMLHDIGDIFYGCPMSEEKKQLMESQLAEMYAQELGVTLKDSKLGVKLPDNQRLESDIKLHINDWLDTLPLNIYSDNDKKELENKKSGLINKMKKLVPVGDVTQMEKETKKFMQEIPLDSEIKDDNNLINHKADELVEKLVLIPEKARTRRYGTSYKGLTDSITNWFDSINIADDAKEEDDIKNMKKDMAYKLTHKVGEMNVDPEIFNDKSLYEDVLRDELHNLLDDVNVTNDDFPEMKENLIKSIKNAQNRAHDEMIGQNYKQKLRDAISTTLPDQQNLSQEEQASTELLKDQLADAFINLHFSGGNEDLKAKMKNKIANEINQFCKNYSKNHPEEPLTSQKLTNDLYTALKNIAFPTDINSLRYEVEQVRIRDEINDWVRELPLEPQSPAELVTRNKMIYVLSKKLFDIEVETSEKEIVPMMRKEILQFEKKMPFLPGENKNANKYANQLIDRLKATEISRKYSESTFVNIDGDGNVTDARVGRGGTRRSVAHGNKPRASFASSGPRATIESTKTYDADSEMCPYYKYLLEKEHILQEQQNLKQSNAFPPCSLSPEDLAHLERIRRRTCLSPKCVTSLLSNKRNAAVGPKPIDTGSQTELRPETFALRKSQESQACPTANNESPRPCPGVPVRQLNQAGYQETRRATISSSIPPNPPNINTPTPPSTNTPTPPSTIPPVPPPPTESRGEVQPHIIIKEYYWDSNENTFKEAELQEAVSAQQRASTAPGQQQIQNQQRMPCDNYIPCPPSNNDSRRPQWGQRAFDIPQDRSSHGSLPRTRSPPCRPPSPCISPLSPTFSPTHQSTPLNSPGFSFRQNEYRIPKRDGLQEAPCVSRPYRRERVIELGSLDDLCNPRPKKRSYTNNNNYEWSHAQFPEEDNFWGAPCMRRVILDEGIDEPLMMEREQREERVRCKCKERLVPKVTRTRSRTFHQPAPLGREDRNNLNRCSKCCGLHCPYPSYLYFR